MDDKYSVVDAVAAAIAGQPLDFENITKSLLADKMTVVVDQKREAVASTLFGPKPDEAEETEATEEQPEESEEESTEETSEVEEEVPAEE